MSVSFLGDPLNSGVALGFPVDNHEKIGCPPKEDHFRKIRGDSPLILAKMAPLLESRREETMESPWEIGLWKSCRGPMPHTILHLYMVVQKLHRNAPILAEQSCQQVVGVGAQRDLFFFVAWRSTSHASSLHLDIHIAKGA